MTDYSKPIANFFKSILSLVGCTYWSITLLNVYENLTKKGSIKPTLHHTICLNYLYDLLYTMRDEIENVSLSSTIYTMLPRVRT